MVTLCLRKFAALIICFVFVDCTYAQSTKEKLQKIFLSKQLKIGDRMHDIPLGDVINNHTGKTKFGDFKGKLVILDFWTTTCSSCFKAFPHMEKLQKQFGDSIQIFLVNGLETKQEVEKIMASRKLKNSKALLPDDLPVIFNAKDLMKLFPHVGDPHHVWIDGKGIIRVRGNQFNTYEEKIRDLLAGKEIFSMNDESTTPLFDKDRPYLLNQSKKLPVQYGSIITSYNNNIAPYGNEVENIVDTSAGTIRNTFLNTQVLDLYFNAFQNRLNQNYQKTIYSNKDYRMAYFLLSDSDTSKYTSQFIETQEGDALTDKEYMKSRYCYEQVNHMNLSEEKRKQYMIDDLNRYFGNLYGTEGRVEKRKVQCFVLVRTSDEEKFILTTKNKDEFFKRNGIQMVQYDNSTLTGAARDLLYQKSFIDSSIQNQNGVPALILDESGFTEKANIVLPDVSEIKNMKDLKTALKSYGLDIIKVERRIDFVVINEKRREIQEGNENEN